MESVVIEFVECIQVDICRGRRICEHTLTSGTYHHISPAFLLANFLLIPHQHPSFPSLTNYHPYRRLGVHRSPVKFYDTPFLPTSIICLL
jgi:hypothetical protein